MKLVVAPVVPQKTHYVECFKICSLKKWFCIFVYFSALSSSWFQHNKFTLFFMGLYFYLYLYLHFYLMCCVSRQIWKTEQETLAEVVGCSTTDWSTNLLCSTCKMWQICGLQVSQYIKGGTKRAWQHFWVTFSCKALFYRHNPRSRGVIYVNIDPNDLFSFWKRKDHFLEQEQEGYPPWCRMVWWVQEIRNVMQSELSNRHARLIYFYRGVATGEREDKETHLHVM